MKAAVFTDRLRYSSDHPVPVPGPDEALIRVTHAGICNTDLEIIKGYMGFQGIPGHEFAGIVEQCSEKGLIGRRVTGEINIGCGHCVYCTGKMQNHCPERRVLGILNKDGACAEYITLPYRNIHRIPDPVTDEQAVFIEPLAAAYEILEQISITRSHSVCVLGDGKLGLLVAQVIASTGSNPLVLGNHEENMAVLDGMGIRTAFAAETRESDFDIVIDCTGSPSGMTKALKLVRPRGTIVLKTTVAGHTPLDMNRFVIREVTLIGSRCGPFSPAIEALLNGQIKIQPLISGRFSIADAVEAFEFASRKGVLKVILRMN